MRDLSTLRERIEQAQQRMRVVQTARERESQALADMWTQIRTRFAEQEIELEGYRARVATLEDTHEELLKLVETLLGGVEGNLNHVQDETVPHIAAAAEELLVNGISPAEHIAAQPAPAPASMPSPVRAVPMPDTPTEPNQPGEEIDDASASPGIRDLIARVQRSVAAPDDRTNGPSDNELEKELREIENLRDELQGLKRRISAAS